MESIKANLIDLFARKTYPVEVRFDSHIREIRKIEEKVSGFLLPGFVDAHVHIESSMLPPAEFARLAVVHGTVATVSDPHEIANVLGVPGVEYIGPDEMLEVTPEAIRLRKLPGKKPAKSKR